MKEVEKPRFQSQFEMHYARSGAGVLAAVEKLFSRGLHVGEGDLLLPLQEAYETYKKVHEL